ncbi:MAG: hypothetical protein R3B48_13015 [Kofleriaceae bacterium]
MMVVRALILSSVLALLGTLDARADGKNERAVALAQEARTAYEEGRWADALALFRVAEGVAHTPVFGLYTARCLHKLGRVVEARDAYRAVAALRLAASASAPFRQAQADARVELAALEAQVPHVAISFARPLPGVRLSLDGAPLTALEEPLPLDPGPHTLKAEAEGARPVTRAFELKLGAPVRRVVLDRSERLVGSVRPAQITGGLAAAALGVGAVTGGVAIVKTRALRRKCPDDQCALKLEPEGASARRYATASDVSFAVGGVLAAASALLYIYRPWGTTTAPGDLTLRVAPGEISAGGSF